VAIIGGSMNPLTGRPRLPVFGGGGLLTLPAWNSADKSASITLSGTNNVTMASTGTLGGVRSVTSHDTGDWYFEVTLGSVGASSPGFGVANSTQSLAAFIGNSLLSIGLYPTDDGNIYQNNIVLGTLGDETSGTWGVQVQATARLISFQKIGSGTPTNYPITATGPLFAMATAGGAGVGVTINTGQAAFAQTLPVGYTAWG